MLRLGQAQHRRDRPERLLAAVAEGAVLEVPVLDEGSPAPHAFNDMGLHLFRPPRWGPQPLPHCIASAPCIRTARLPTHLQ